MIVDKISNLKQYNISKTYVNKILEFIENAKNTQVFPGRHDILGDDLFALVQKYDTKDAENCNMESHEMYIDLQYILQGQEQLLWDFADELELIEDKRPDADIMFYNKSLQGAAVLLKEDMFTLLFPNDAHAPCIKDTQVSKVSKIVFKIKHL